MRTRTAFLAFAGISILCLSLTASVVSATVTTDFSFALKKDDYAIWKRTTNMNVSMGGPPTTNTTVAYEKRVLKNSTVISSGNECNFTVEVYQNNTDNPSMTDASGWASNTTKLSSILNKTVGGMMNATPIYPKDVGLDEIYTTELGQEFDKLMDVMPIPQNTSSMTIYVLKNELTNQQISGTALSGSLNMTYELALKYNMSAAPSTFYIQNQTILMVENVTIDVNHLVDQDTTSMNSSAILYLESMPGSPLMNITMLIEGVSTLEHTYIQTSPVPGYSTMVILGVICITSSLLMKKVLSRKIRAA